MKPTTRVSIGGVAFFLDEDAYQLLDAYLKSLHRHFAHSSESDEIIADIEYRLCELLQMRISNENEVISSSMAQDILNIMGNPSDFDDAVEDESDAQEETQQPQQKSDKDTKGFRHRRLFRDLNQRIIGGVCSGLGHYFRFDPVLIRVIFVALFFGLIPLIPKMTGAVLLFYAILWAIMPKARTFEEQVAMKGYSANLKKMEAREDIQPIKYKGSFVGNILSGFCKFVLILLAISFGIATLALLIFYILGMWVMPNDFDLVNTLIVGGVNTFNFKLATLLLCILPIFGLFSLVVKILKRTPFKTQNGVLLTLGILLWFTAIGYVGFKGANIGLEIEDRDENGRTASVRKMFTIPDSITTIYLELDDVQNIKKHRTSTGLLYKNGENNRRMVAYDPTISFFRDSTVTDIEILIQAEGYPADLSTEQLQELLKANYQLKDSVLLVSLKWYDDEHPWRGESHSVTINFPLGYGIEFGKFLK